MKPTPFHLLEYGKLYRLVGAFHVWDSERWVGSPVGLVAGVYAGQEPGNPDRHLFHDTGMTYAATVTTPPSSSCYVLKPIKRGSATAVRTLRVRREV